MKVEIWSDVVCPFCYVGKRRFGNALESFPHADVVTVLWRSFELDPGAPARTPGTLEERLAAKYGVTLAEARAMNERVVAMSHGEGLEVRLDLAKPGSTFGAHRLIHLAAEHGLQHQAKERALRAYWLEGRPIGELDTLVEIGIEIGLEPAVVRAALEGDAYAEAVREDEREAASLGVQGVPFFVFDRRFAVSGAQPTELFGRALQQAWQATSHQASVAAS